MEALGGAVSSSPKNYIQEYKPNQISLIRGNALVISTTLEGPISTGDGSSPFGYVTSSQWQNNPNTFDLWVDVIVGGKTNRISNWRDDPELVSY